MTYLCRSAVKHNQSCQCPLSNYCLFSARVLLVDLGSSFYSDVGHDLCDVLENLFSLACNISGPSRIPFFSILTVAPGPEVKAYTTRMYRHPWIQVSICGIVPLPLMGFKPERQQRRASSFKARHLRSPLGHGGPTSTLNATCFQLFLINKLRYCWHWKI